MAVKAIEIDAAFKRELAICDVSEAATAAGVDFRTATALEEATAPHEAEAGRHARAMLQLQSVGIVGLAAKAQAIVWALGHRDEIEDCPEDAISERLLFSLVRDVLALAPQVDDKGATVAAAPVSTHIDDAMPLDLNSLNSATLAAIRAAQDALFELDRRADELDQRLRTVLDPAHVEALGVAGLKAQWDEERLAAFEALAALIPQAAHAA